MNDDFGVVRALAYPIKTQLYPRSGHRTILVEQQILIFGGYSHTGEYNTTIIKVDCETMTPDIVRSKNTLKLSAFCIFYWEDSVYFWGGNGPSKKDPRLSICKNQLIRFSNGEFEPCQQKGSIPCCRQNHAFCVLPNKGVVIMGGNNGNKFLDDWHFLDFKSMTWSSIQLDFHLPLYLDSLLFWKAGRGFILSGQKYEDNKRQLKENSLYEFKFTDFRQRKLHIEPIHVTADSKQCFPRSSPVACLVTLDSPYIVLIGGTKSYGQNSLSICNSVECFNIQTLEWFPLNHAPQAGCAFEALYSNEKIYMIGGLSRKNQVFQAIQYIEFKIDYLQARICRSCREIYGLKNMSLEGQSIHIKQDINFYPKSFLSSEMVGKFSYYMNYPFSAIGLLIDNSLNLSGSNIDVDFRKFKNKQKSDRAQPFDFISITDNSMGFNSYQILDSLCSFSLKTQKYTNDKRYEQEIQIRKQYGINLKLGALRLGKSCLFMTKVEEKEERYRLIAYFSTAPPLSSQPFTVTYYMLSQSGECSSEVARHLIQRNVSNKIPNDYESLSVMTLIYIFDFDNLEMELKGQTKTQVTSIYPSSKIFRCLEDYVQSLYLKPYVGRLIRVNGKAIKFRDFIQLLKLDQSTGKIIQVDQDDYELAQNQDYIAKLKIYKIVDKTYFLRDILCYHKNRLLSTLKGLDDRYCGILEYNEHLSVDICKTRLQNRAIEIAVNHRIRSVMLKHRQKRSMPLVTKSLNSPLSRQAQNRAPQ